MYSEKRSRDNYRRLNSFGDTTYNYVVGSYSPNSCDTQYELVRVQSANYSPWKPLQEEVWTSYYNREDPFEAERQKEMAFRNGMNQNSQNVNSANLGSRMVLPQGGQPNPQVPQGMQQEFMNRMMAQQLQQVPSQVQINQQGQFAGAQPPNSRVPFREWNDKRFIQLDNSCPSCVNDNKDCSDNECSLGDYSYMLQPACSAIKPCMKSRDHANALGRRPSFVITAPI